ncbi:MetQ/NlpA family ABC transporter substrate-binding protein [Pectobacterium atrosepticum]|uniref:MetQ/NlpA family ABC transporter substrate-binding protein n=1 Tax=Pectobacterium atrosepticum TaxID=29471 RepID=UPI0003AA0881|nr:MetQ/NlpA family ABC transporter substrate-binding protein [Pectobacterium atrosepticum]GKV85023.1 metal ABC transporter substrate-binding protein [Pectobacterium carotovorum subsp. carotovorum]AIA71505.1 methionine ABC transporter ATPase [Pectobacterium atrosepticum]AIK13690.1 putative lipoprotein [Pectobacterium atrosepticum]ATY90570.1 metal ABC transporter substrate-binding protein [Pectobacterium atrosepticum]KFX16209.1 methionine ABC transporter ATPase [Pectobacterium atrosepticum]
MKLTHSVRAALGITLFAAGMQLAMASSDPQTITFGVAPGPYGDMVNLAIKPELVKKGYKVVVREFSDYVQPNLALANGSIDANLFQHTLYLEKFAADKGLKISPLIVVPTASMGFYSKKITSLDELKKGDVITLSNDATNLARGLRFLQSMGLITIKADIDPTKASEKDILENPRGLVFKPMEAAQLPRTLDSVAASLVNGNFALASGMKLSSAIKLETLDENLKNIIAVRTDDLDKPFVKDTKAIVESPAYAAVINDPALMYSQFQKPEWMQAKTPAPAQ